eukprot:15713-Heterococcus_DN1.PRE.6
MTSCSSACKSAYTERITLRVTSSTCILRIGTAPSSSSSVLLTQPAGPYYCQLLRAESTINVPQVHY